MADALSWLTQVEGGGAGGFFSTHPATAERIEAVMKMQ
jgi:Zn-dependent protease with chaperone function